MRYYVHGAGRGGRAAWPQQSEAESVFADHEELSVMQDKVIAVSEQAPRGAAVVVAHSLGAVPVALAHRSGDLAATHLVLLEPALYDVARGDAAIEGHIGPMTQARELARARDLYGFWQVVAPLMFGRTATRDEWDADQPLAHRFASMDPPWGHDVEADVFAGVPTLVVTGDWNDEYEAIAHRLEEAGAAHVHLPGFRHRPQDHPEMERVIAEFTDTRA